MSVLRSSGRLFFYWLGKRVETYVKEHSSMHLRLHPPVFREVCSLMVLAFGWRKHFSTKRCLVFLSNSSNSFFVQSIKPPLYRTTATSQMLTAFIRLRAFSLDFKSGPNILKYALLSAFFISWLFHILIFRSLVVSNLLSETKGSRFKSGCQLC